MAEYSQGASCPGPAGRDQHATRSEVFLLREPTPFQPQHRGRVASSFLSASTSGKSTPSPSTVASSASFITSSSGTGSSASKANTVSSQSVCSNTAAFFVPGAICEDHVILDVLVLFR